MIWIVDVYEILLVGTPRTRTLDNVPNMSVSKTDHADTVRRQSHARTHGGRGRWTMSQYVHVRHIWRGHRKCTTLSRGTMLYFSNIFTCGQPNTSKGFGSFLVGRQ